MTPQEIISKAESFGDWYHRIELTPGYFTKSRMQGSFHIWDMVRKVRANLSYEGKSVLDIGTMDGMWAFEAEGLGAAEVIAGDIWQADEKGRARCQFAIQCRNSRSSAIYANAETLSTWIERRFDIVQCLGMLYHVENPLIALRQMRRLMNDDGVMLLETACCHDVEDYPMVRLNTDNGVYFDDTTFWVPNDKALRGMLELTGFKPIESTIATTPEPKSYRTCMVCELI